MSTDLSRLTTAADRWDGMAGEFEKREKAYRRDVHGISLGNSWQGLSADAANKRFDATLKQFQSAQTEAKAIASLLREAHANLVDLTGKLKAARQEAIDAKMTVSDQGVVGYDYSQLTESDKNALHHDPDYEEGIRKAVGSWQDRIEHAVQAVSDADKGIEIALGAVVLDLDVSDGTMGTGFNGQAKGDIGAYTKKEPAPTQTDGWLKVTGPSAGFSLTTDPKYGKEGSVKAYADLFHVTAKGSLTEGDLKLSGISDVYGGARATANYGFNDKGLVAKAEASVGLRDLAEVRADYGDLAGVYGRTDGFAGAEASANLKLTKEESVVKLKGFYGAKQGVAGGGEFAGIGIGASTEGGIGDGGSAWAGWKKENGTWKLGAKGFVADAVGAGAGVEITFNPHKFSKPSAVRLTRSVTRPVMRSIRSATASDPSGEASSTCSDSLLWKEGPKCPRHCPYPWSSDCRRAGSQPIRSSLRPRAWPSPRCIRDRTPDSPPTSPSTEASHWRGSRWSSSPTRRWSSSARAPSRWWWPTVARSAPRTPPP
ncbi:hypothetical protein ACIBL5_37780 [Streptomyces sp. NPDC050516]|uniref:hypothetical protein n=1 Tax=Streptomyces sp. NPDC050516 TaxID=3365621 RepID=UPI0037B569BB